MDEATNNPHSPGAPFYRCVNMEECERCRYLAMLERIRSPEEVAEIMRNADDGDALSLWLISYWTFRGWNGFAQNYYHALYLREMAECAVLAIRIIESENDEPELGDESD